MNELILVKTYYAVVDDLGNTHGIDHRRPRMEGLLKKLRQSASSNDERSYCLCELLPARTYDFVPLERRVQYPPITPITDAEPKYLVPGPDGPIECVPTIHARRTEHVLDQYLELHERWQAVFSKYIRSSSWLIEPHEADAFVAALLGAGRDDEAPSAATDVDADGLVGATDNRESDAAGSALSDSVSPPYRDTRFLRNLEEGSSPNTTEATP